MTLDQVKSARALLGWSKLQLGLRSGTSSRMVKMFENTRRVASLSSFGRTEQVDALVAVRATFKAFGIKFTNGNTPGVHLRRFESMSCKDRD